MIFWGTLTLTPTPNASPNVGLLSDDHVVVGHSRRLYLLDAPIIGDATSQTIFKQRDTSDVIQHRRTRRGGLGGLHSPWVRPKKFLRPKFLGEDLFFVAFQYQSWALSSEIWAYSPKLMAK